MSSRPLHGPYPSFLAGMLPAPMGPPCQLPPSCQGPAPCHILCGASAVPTPAAVLPHTHQTTHTCRAHHSWGSVHTPHAAVVYLPSNPCVCSEQGAHRLRELRASRCGPRVSLDCLAMGRGGPRGSLALTLGSRAGTKQRGWGCPQTELRGQACVGPGQFGGDVGAEGPRLGPEGQMSLPARCPHSPSPLPALCQPIARTLPARCPHSATSEMLSPGTPFQVGPLLCQVVEFTVGEQIK